jgi:branched-chain amino acid aminotransferase
VKVLNSEEWLKALKKSRKKCDYRAMYSSWAGGIVTDPELMLVPVDDHLVHRGDGVFEALMFSPTCVFEFEPHIDRLFRSSEMIGLPCPISKDELMDLCRKVIESSGLKEGFLRIFLSRGPGDFSPNPYSTVGSQLYVVAIPRPPEKRELYEKGAKLILSRVPVKPFPYAQIKSCNYLQNVMTKKESVDKGADFAVNLTDKGEVTEGPTENLLVLTSRRELVAPPFDYTLRGTTLLRVFEVAKSLQKDFDFTYVGQKILEPKDLETALEIMMVGTSLGVCPVTEYEGRPVAGGQVGPVAQRLHQELAKITGVV